MREPTLAWWPGKIAAGSVCDTVAGNIDLLPTFVKLAGGTVPADRKIDGRDISPVLLGQTKEAQREAHYYYHGYKLEAVRVGPWKLAVSAQPEKMGRGDKSNGSTGKGVRLYNLDADIGEQTDVAAQHPDVVKRLQALATAMAAELGDGKPGPGVRPAGFVEKPVLLYASDEAGKKNAAPAKAKAKGKTAQSTGSLGALKLGDVLNPTDAPKIANRPFTITCEIEPKGPNGVMVAHGGKAVGYALHLKEGRVVFTVHASSKAVSIVATEAVAGRAAVEARLGADGAMSLLINGKSVATGQAGSLINREPAEDFCVGFDDAVPVTEYAGDMHFQGKLENLKVAVGTK